MRTAPFGLGLFKLNNETLPRLAEIRSRGAHKPSISPESAQFFVRHLAEALA
jgi:hypothetical protein